jgi:hypothetical protein
MEHPTGSEPPTIGESSRAIEERARSSGVANQHTTEQQHKETAPAFEEPSAALGGVMGY